MEKETKRSESSFIEQISQLLDPRYFDEKGNPLNMSSEFEDAMNWFEGTARKRLFRENRDMIRGKMQAFVAGADMPEGYTNVNVMGNYVVGNQPKNKYNKAALSKRAVGEAIYSRSLAQAFDEVLKEMSFTIREDNNYETPEQAFLAVEADSISKKGPYDGGTQDAGLKQVSTVLEGALSFKAMPEEDDAPYGEYLLSRREELAGYVDSSHPTQPSDWVERQSSHGLKATMRGFPFMAAGNSKMKRLWYELSKEMFFNTEIKWAEYEHYKNYTVDEFIQWTLKWLKDNDVKSTEWFNLRHAIIVIISRNQGAAFKIDVQDDFKWLGERKDFKWRIIAPVSAFVQAYSTLGASDLLKKIMATPGRIGLQTPSENKRRFNEFLQDAQTFEQILISSDFSAYDSTLSSRKMALNCGSFATLYEDEWTKDAMSLAATTLAHKIMIMPTYVDDDDGLYANFTHRDLDVFKGNKFHAISKARNLLSVHVRKQVEDAEKNDYRIRAFYFYKSYLPSGHILTNLVGSEVTISYGAFFVPYYLFKNGHITEKEWKQVKLAFGSGDDMVMGVSKRLFDLLGYKRLLELLEKAFLYFGMTVTASKQVKILINGYPIVDFLQEVYPQQNGFETLEPYKKFLRQMPAWPYSERYSKLPTVGQWVIPSGKMEAGLCSLNIKTAVKTFHRAGEIMRNISHETKYKPLIVDSIRNSANPYTYSSEFGINMSPFGGLEQWCGLVRNYGQGTVSALGSYIAKSGNEDVLKKTFDAEFETRAPHKASFARAYYSALKLDPDEVGSEVMSRTEGNETYHFLSVDFAEELMRVSGEIIAPIILDESVSTSAEQDQASDFVTMGDDPDDYEVR
jgi:hypothetical protein